MDGDDQSGRSIFSRPEERVEPAVPPRSAQPPQDPTVVRGPDRPPPAPGPEVWRPEPHAPSREGMSSQVVVLSAMGIAVLVLAGFIIASLLGPGDQAASLIDASPTTAASPEASVAPDASASATASPTPRPVPAVALESGRWATVVTNAVNVRAEPSLEAPLAGRADNGEIVYVISDHTVEADGLTWYRAVADPGEAGWMAGHAEFEQLMLSDSPDLEFRWCAVPGRQVIGLDPGTREPVIGGGIELGGAPFSTDLLSAGGVAAVELAWGAQEEVCLEVAVVDGRTSTARIDAELEACGHPLLGATPTQLSFGTGAVAPDGSVDTRVAVLHDTILGYAPLGSSNPPNLADLLVMAGSVQPGQTGDRICLTLTATGGPSDTTIAAVGRTDQCAILNSISSDAVAIQAASGAWGVDLRLTEGSRVDEDLLTFGPEGVRLTAHRSLEGPVALDPKGGMCP